MRNLRFEYHMQLTFELPAFNHHFTVRCEPATDERQHILTEEINIYPKHFDSRQVDSFGNHCIYGIANDAHNYFAVDVNGEAKVENTPRVPALPSHRIGMFRYASELTKAGQKVTEMFGAASLVSDWSKMSSVSKAMACMNCLYDRYRYEPGVTGIDMNAEEALELGAGVCQDYAHILLALCRAENIPCRYVVGMMLGEGASHAWIEVYEDDFWTGLDPTHNRLIDDNYIKISCGRDAKDCQINQGVFAGGGKQKQEIRVSVWEA